MTASEAFSQPFVQVTLPILVGFFIATGVRNRGFDGVNRRLDDFKGEVIRRFEAIDRRFEAIDSRFDFVERRLELIQGDLHQMEIRITKLKK